MVQVKVCSLCKERTPLKEFNRRRSSKDGLQNHCKECNRERSKAYYHRNRKHHIKNIGDRRRSYYKWFREMIADVKKANPCLACGETEICCLDFHHKNKKDKLESIGALVRLQWGLPRILEELKKCVVLCSNCHRKLHTGVISLPKRPRINLASVAQR